MQIKWQGLADFNSSMRSSKQPKPPVKPSPRQKTAHKIQFSKTSQDLLPLTVKEKFYPKHLKQMSHFFQILKVVGHPRKPVELQIMNSIMRRNQEQALLKIKEYNCEKFDARIQTQIVSYPYKMLDAFFRGKHRQAIQQGFEQILKSMYGQQGKAYGSENIVRVAMVAAQRLNYSFFFRKLRSVGSPRSNSQVQHSIGRVVKLCAQKYEQHLGRFFMSLLHKPVGSAQPAKRQPERSKSVFMNQKTMLDLEDVRSRYRRETRMVIPLDEDSEEEDARCKELSAMRKKLLSLKEQIEETKIECNRKSAEIKKQASTYLHRANQEFKRNQKELKKLKLIAEENELYLSELSETVLLRNRSIVSEDQVKRLYKFIYGLQDSEVRVSMVREELQQITPKDMDYGNEWSIQRNIQLNNLLNVYQNVSFNKKPEKYIILEEENTNLKQMLSSIVTFELRKFLKTEINDKISDLDKAVNAYKLMLDSRKH